MMQAKKHLTPKGVENIVAIKASLNKGLSDKLQMAFPNVIKSSRLEVANKISDTNWLAGFTAAEGCFYVKIRKSSNYLTGFQISLEFSIAQQIRDKELLKSFVNYLCCGKLYSYPDQPWVSYKCTKISDIESKIIPYFEKHKIYGVKSEYFKKFAEIAKLISDKRHLTLEGLEKIKSIKATMNINNN